MNIAAEVREERDRQDSMWGHDFDDKNTLNDWSTFIARYAARAADTDLPSEARKNLVKAAALAVAAIEAFDRNHGFALRHYD